MDFSSNELLKYLIGFSLSFNTFYLKGRFFSSVWGKSLTFMSFLITHSKMSKQREKQVEMDWPCWFSTSIHPLASLHPPMLGKSPLTDIFNSSMYLKNTWGMTFKRTEAPLWYIMIFILTLTRLKKEILISKKKKKHLGSLKLSSYD